MGRPAAGELRIVQLNPNAWPAMREWLVQQGQPGHVICGQEHKLDAGALLNVCAATKKAGYTVSGAPAMVTNPSGDARHRSGGVMVAVANHLHSELLCALGRADLSPSDAPGRLTGRWIDAMGGIVALSAYFQDGVGWNAVNIALAKQLAVVTCTCGCPWVISMDGNMEPDAFYASEIVQHMPGVIVRPRLGTCRYLDAWKCYDYFYVDQRLEPYVIEARTLRDWHTVPHKPVMLRLAAKGAPVYKVIQIAPRPLPIQLPVGCVRQPPVRQSLDSEEGKAMGVTELFAEVVSRIEEDVLSRNDIVGAEARRYAGRASR